MHDRGGVTLAPLGEAFALAIEVLEQYRHAHRHGLHREAAAKCGFRRRELIDDVALHDEDGCTVLARGCELRLVADEDEAAGTCASRHVAVGCNRVQVAVQVREDVAMPALDRVCIEHEVPFQS